MLQGGAVLVLVMSISIALTPGTWSDYRALLAAASAPTGSYNVLASVPVWLRLGIAGVLAFAAIRWIRLAPIAVTMAYPVVWFHGLSTLTAIVAPVDSPRRVEPDG
ncbi:MAG: hypothetical protein V4515_13415 [Chloroflexota bacterium]